MRKILVASRAIVTRSSVVAPSHLAGPEMRRGSEQASMFTIIAAVAVHRSVTTCRCSAPTRTDRRAAINCDRSRQTPELVIEIAPGPVSPAGMANQH